ncbi:MAG: hypothetical protein JOZ25_05255 [Actinobacteria bacterium]|nr:hypothetical protein [Actinomycetota bacterium]
MPSHGSVIQVTAIAARPLDAARFLDRPGEIAVAAATLLALAAVVASLPPLLAARQRDATRTRLTPSLVMLTGGAAITFAAYLAFQIRCNGTACRSGAGGGPAELARWWRSESTWEWGAQLFLASVGLAAASAAFWLSARASNRSRSTLWAARVLYLLWALFVVVVPGAWELTS